MKSNGQIRLKVYGTRGSYSSTFNQETAVGVNTTCLRVDIGKNIIIIDAGSGIINCGQDLIKELIAERGDEPKWKVHLLFTHLHIDHLVGFPYFSMIYVPKSEIHFISPRILDYDLENVLDLFVHPPFFPVSLQDLPFEGHFHNMAESKVIYFYADRFEILKSAETAPKGWQGKISCMRNYMHPKGGSYFYKIESPAGRKAVFASDTEGFVGGDQRLIQFASGADLLFHDAQYSLKEYAMFQGFGHSTYEMACEVARQAGVKKLLLIHHDPKHTDKELRELEASAQKIFPETFAGAEKMEFQI